jgi:hypothetical protein
MAKEWARLIETVVFPTPPFWLDTAILITRFLILLAQNSFGLPHRKSFLHSASSFSPPLNFENFRHAPFEIPKIRLPIPTLVAVVAFYKLLPPRRSVR